MFSEYKNVAVLASTLSGFVLGLPAPAQAHVKWFCAFSVAGQPNGLNNVLCQDFELLSVIAIARPRVRRARRPLVHRRGDEPFARPCLRPRRGAARSPRARRRRPDDGRSLDAGRDHPHAGTHHHLAGHPMASARHRRVPHRQAHPAAGVARHRDAVHDRADELRRIPPRRLPDLPRRRRLSRRGGSRSHGLRRASARLPALEPSPSP